MKSGNVDELAVKPEDKAEPAVTKAQRVGRDGFEHRLYVAPRAADDAQDIPRGGLLLQCLRHASLEFPARGILALRRLPGSRPPGFDFSLRGLCQPSHPPSLPRYRRTPGAMNDRLREDARVRLLRHRVRTLSRSRLPSAPCRVCGALAAHPSHSHAAPRTPLESPCACRTSRVSTRSENTHAPQRCGTFA